MQPYYLLPTNSSILSSLGPNVVLPLRYLELVLAGSVLGRIGQSCGAARRVRLGGFGPVGQADLDLGGNLVDLVGSSDVVAGRSSCHLFR